MSATVGRRGLGLAVAVGTAALLGACSSDDASTVRATDAWIRPSPDVANGAEGYLELTAEDDDALVEVEVDPEVAAGAALRDVADPAADGDVVITEPVDAIDLPAGEAVVLEPGGPHVVLLGLTEALADDDEVELTLTFEGGATETVTAEVRDE